MFFLSRPGVGRRGHASLLLTRPGFWRPTGVRLLQQISQQCLQVRNNRKPVIGLKKQFRMYSISFPMKQYKYPFCCPYVDHGRFRTRNDGSDRWFQKLFPPHLWIDKNRKCHETRSKESWRVPSGSRSCAIVWREFYQTTKCRVYRTKFSRSSLNYLMMIVILKLWNKYNNARRWRK